MISFSAILTDRPAHRILCRRSSRSNAVSRHQRLLVSRRHAFASITLEGGVSVKEVATLLEHLTPSSTLSTYVRSMEGTGRKAIGALAQRLVLG